MKDGETGSIETLFKIGNEQLRRVLQNATNAPVSSYSFTINKTKQSASGIVGDYLIPTFTITAQDGRSCEKDLFVRRQPEGQQGFAQAHHYRYLESQHVPTPKLYGWFIDNDGREILCLEYLSEIMENDQAFLRDSKNCRSFLELMAKFTANCPSMEYLALVGRDMAYRGEYTREWKTWMLWSIYMLDTVWDHALNGRLNTHLKELCQSQLHAKLQLQTIARHMITYIHQFDLGIIHGDFKPGNTAWRTDNKELVIFDLEDMMLDTKFYDAAMILGAPESMSKIDYPVIDDLIEFFMNQYTLCSGNSLYFEAFKRELQIVWFTRTLNLWEWLPHELHGPHYQDPEKGKDHLERCAYLFAVLHSLIDQLPVTELLISQ